MQPNNLNFINTSILGHKFKTAPRESLRRAAKINKIKITTSFGVGFSQSLRVFNTLLLVAFTLAILLKLLCYRNGHIPWRKTERSLKYGTLKNQ